MVSYSGSKLGIRELRDFISQLLFDFYHIIPQFRRELRDCLVLQDKTTLSRWENINNNSKNKILYINRWSRPAQLILKQLIKGFFNRWKCRVQNTPQSAGSIQTTLHNLLPYLQVLDNFTIKNLHFTQMVNVNNNQMKVRQVIEHSYTKVRSIGYRFAATATSKLLHILQPELFVMWDKDILNHYKQINSQVSDSGQGYYVYLEIMQQVATQVNQSFQNATLNPPAGANQNPAVYLSTQMNYNSPKTLAKYLDEYNWVTITNGV